MNADDHRRHLDLLATWVIRLVSGVVLCIILAFFFELFRTAVPVFQDPIIRTVDKTPASADPIVEPLPKWVPEHLPLIAWRESRDQRLWIAGDVSGMLEGVVSYPDSLGGPEVTLPLELPSLPFSPQWLWLTPDMITLFAFASEGQYAAINLRTTSLQASRWPDAKSFHLMAGGRSIVVVGSDWLSLAQVDHVTAVPSLVAMQRLDVADPLIAVSTAPDQPYIAGLAEGDNLIVWKPPVSTALIQYQLPRGARDIAWSQEGLLINYADENRLLEVVLSDRGTVRLVELFSKQEYEGYAEADYIWQPTAPVKGYTSKLSLVPLIIGTIKTAFLAILIAVPLGIGSAIYVGFFMRPSVRERIKPVVELMAAFPTVVLGAFAAVWLLPRFLQWVPELIGVILILFPGLYALGIVRRYWSLGLFAKKIPLPLPLAIMPWVLILIFFGIELGALVEEGLMHGNVQSWLLQSFGIRLHHNSTLLVSWVLAFALVPTVFSLSEDAVFGVPRAASLGATALGASQWQSFRDIVLPVAMPGLIAAVMLTLGRAFGETMLLLMVAGNAPSVDWTFLDAARTITATLAIELSEASVGGTHYRVLFLGALILFVLTFLLNSIAEIIRFRMWRRYRVDSYE